MTKPTILITASLRLSKNCSSGRPSGPICTSTTPSAVENVMTPGDVRNRSFKETVADVGFTKFEGTKDIEIVSSLDEIVGDHGLKNSKNSLEGRDGGRGGDRLARVRRHTAAWAVVSGKIKGEKEIGEDNENGRLKESETQRRAAVLGRTWSDGSVEHNSKNDCNGGGNEKVQDSADYKLSLRSL